MAHVDGADVRMGTIDGLADSLHYFAATAVSPQSVESGPSNIVCIPRPGFACADAPLEPPGAVSNLTVTVVETPAVTVQIAQDGDLFNIVVTGSGPLRLAFVPVGATLDWFKVGGQNTADIPGVTPALGGNNDGRSANAITFTAPVNGWADQDGSDPTGITATVSGVTKSLVRSGNNWTTSFP